MHHKKVFLIGLAVVFFVTSQVYAGSCGKDEIIGAVEWGVNILEEKGEAAFDKIREYNFCNGKGYISVTSMEGVTLCHPMIKLEGNNQTMNQGAKGKYFMAEMKEKAQNYGQGWVNYWWPDKKTGSLIFKCAFVKTVIMDGKEVFVSSGLPGIPEDQCN
jgi:hypothetical protein